MTVLRIYYGGNMREVWVDSARNIYRIGFHILRRARYMNEPLPTMSCSYGKISAWLLEERQRILCDEYLSIDTQVLKDISEKL